MEIIVKTRCYPKGTMSYSPTARRLYFSNQAKLKKIEREFAESIGFNRKKYTQAVEITIIFAFKHKTKTEYHTAKPDLDKLARTVLDILVNLGILSDDSIVSRLVLEKRYHVEDQICVKIKELYHE